MKASIASLDRLNPIEKPRALNAWAKTILQRQLSSLNHGEIVIDDGEIHRFGRTTTDFPVTATVFVGSEEFYGDTVFGGSVGAAESYMAGHWSCTDLTSLVRILVRNRQVLDGMDSGFSRVAEPLRRLIHALNRNTRAGSRSNIAAHYDLGNDFFNLFLDETWMYSCAYFPDPSVSLTQASIAKLDLICRKLSLSPDDHVIEIGTGWGGFALHAARHYGCRVTTTTISRQQFEFARERIQEAGLSDRITLLFEDYRDLEGQYDKLVSIEMIEAVGHQYYPTYFAKCAELLKPEGSALIQAITISDQEYARAKDEVDFIKRYIFPGSCIPSITALLEAATRASDLKLIGMEDIGPHYATTLRRWREGFFSKLDEVKGLGYSDTFIRMWEFYLCYCEGGFEERALGNAHLLLAKPGFRG